MPRFRPFISESSSAAPVLVDVVKVVDGSRYIAREELNDELPDSAYFDLEKMVESTDVRLDPVNSVLFPAKRVDFDLSGLSGSDDNSKIDENKGVTTNA